MVGAGTFEQVRDTHDECFPHSPYSMFPEIEKEYLGKELPRRLAEWEKDRHHRGPEDGGPGLA